MEANQISWKVKQLRFTVFPKLGEQLKLNKLWETVVGSTPTQEIVLPHQKTLEAEGAYKGHTIGLRVSSGRVDWFLKKQQRQNNKKVVQEKKLEGTFLFDDLEELETVGELTNCLTTFNIFIEKWIKSEFFLAPDRMALEIALFFPIKSLQKGYEYINLFLPFKIDVEKTKNFFYQANFPRIIEELHGIQFNCISHWKVITWLRETLTGPVRGFACNPVVETNTDPKVSKKITKENSMDIYHELLTLANNIAIDGVKNATS